jgi:hypothetical protein
MSSLIKKFHVAFVLAVVLAFPLLQVPTAYSAEWSAPEKAMSFLTDVVRLDMTKYKATLVNHRVEYPSDLGGLAKEYVDYILESDESKLDVGCVFINKTLDFCILYVDKGSPLYVQPSTNFLDAAKGLLERYQTYSGASHLQEMRNMLDTLTEMKTMTTTVGNIKLEVSTGGDSAYFSWMYTFDGIDATRKGTYIYFEHGSFKYFSDGWGIYSIGSTDINVSEEEAIRIAREHAENYTLKIWTGNWTVMNFTIVDEPLKAEFSMERREPLTLYPFWHIQLYFDKAYGTSNGIEVGIWADTGEVLFCQATGIAGGPPTEDSTTPTTEPPEEPPTEESQAVPPTEPPTDLSTEPPTETLPDDSAGKTGLDPTLLIIAVPIVLAIILGATIYKRKR